MTDLERAIAARTTPRRRCACRPLSEAELIQGRGMTLDDFDDRLNARSISLSGMVDNEGASVRDAAGQDV